MHLSEMSVKIGKDRKLSKSAICLPENVECIPLAVVIMTTANGMRLTVSGYRLIFFIISDQSINQP